MIKEKLKLKKLEKQASSLLDKMIKEKLPEKVGPTENDIEFKKILKQRYEISPSCSDSYVSKYNNIQKEKSDSQNLCYTKSIKPNPQLNSDNKITH